MTTRQRSRELVEQIGPNLALNQMDIKSLIKQKIPLIADGCDILSGQGRACFHYLINTPSKLRVSVTTCASKTHARSEQQGDSIPHGWIDRQI